MYNISRNSMDYYSEVFTEYKLGGKHTFAVDTAYKLLDEAGKIAGKGAVIVSVKGDVNDGKGLIRLRQVKTEFPVINNGKDVSFSPEVYIMTLQKIYSRFGIKLEPEDEEDMLKYAERGMRSDYTQIPLAESNSK